MWVGGFEKREIHRGRETKRQRNREGRGSQDGYLLVERLLFIRRLLGRSVVEISIFFFLADPAAKIS